MGAPFFLAAGRLVDLGRADLDDALLEECLDTLSCDLPPEACFAAFTGRGEEGSGCLTNDECQPALHCDFGVFGCSRCTADFARGTPCVADVECAGHPAGFDPGPGCVPTVDGRRICGTLDIISVEVGSPCGTEFVAPGSIVSRRCDESSACIDGTCVPLPLTAGDACDLGLVCREGQCVAASLLGEPCIPIGFGSNCDPRQPLSCIAGRCEAEPDEPGDSCELTCASGLRCIERRCAMPGGIGAGCVFHADCAEGLCAPSGECVVPEC